MDFFFNYLRSVFVHPQRAARSTCTGTRWRSAFALVLLFQAGAVHALSNACSTLNSNSGATSYNARFTSADFDAGEDISFSYFDNGQGIGRSALTADVVNIRSRDLGTVYSDYRSHTGTAGSHSARVSASQLATGGLYLTISTGTYIGLVTIHCTGGVSNDASLSSLALSTGALSPVFASATTSYSASVSNTTTSLLVRPAVSATGSTITVNGSPVGSGTDSSQINLNVGLNTISVIVTAADNVTTKTYTLSVTRAEAAPVVSNVTATVAANSSSTPISLIITGTATTVAVASAATHGTATATGTSISYTPAPGFSGSDSFTYTATNTAGTSAAATVSVTVTASALILSPATGSLPAATVGTTYNQVFSATGGASPYRFSAAGVPAGLTLDPSTGALTGVPTTQGSVSLSVTVTDANALQASATYSLTIATTPNAPNAADTAVATRAGQSVSVDLSAGATGGPFISATLVQVPALELGKASLNGLSLTFTPTAKASGLLALRYTLTNQQGTSQPATLTIQISARPDPGQDQEVVGTVTAQAQSAAQFAKAQISNFNDRLEQLHGMDGHRNAFNLRFGLSQAEAPHKADDDLDIFRSLTTLQAAPDEQWALQRASQAKASDTPPAGDVSLWTGGYVDFGKTQRSGAKVSNTLIGISGGIDYRLSRSMTVGAGIGIGRDKNDIGSSSSSRGESYSAAVYGSYHPEPVFFDALLGYSWLTFDSDRYVSDVARYASGNRQGDQLFGSLSSGYEARGENWLLSPYGRLDASTTWLHGFTESDAAQYNLDYADQRISLLSGVAGLRGQYGIPLGWSYLNLRSRVEYSHTLNAGSTAKMGYADIGDDAYSIRTEGLSQNTILGSMGVDFLWASGLTTGVSYQGTRALGEQSRSDSLSMRVAYRF